MASRDEKFSYVSIQLLPFKKRKKREEEKKQEEESFPANQI